MKVNLAWFCYSLLFATCGAKRREYFVAIKEIQWAYEPLDGESNQQQVGGPVIIPTYKKAVYRQYTDGSFTVESPRPPSLGLYGPILRAEVKDTLVVHALNLASRPYSFHPHGVFYLKSSEGASYANDSTISAGDAISPGDSHTYIWEIRDEYGPGPEDPNCIPWAYHSHVDSTKDQNSGLIGTLLTCRKGVLTSTGSRTDVDRDFSVIAFAIDENESWYVEENIEKYAASKTVDKTVQEFAEGNIKYSINGKTRGGLDGLEMCEGDFVHWYLLGMGSDSHAVQFVGNTVIVNGHRLDTVPLSPATFLTAVMRADNPGNWNLVCQVTNHATGGMMVQYAIHTKCGGDKERQRNNNGIGRIRKYYIAAEEMDWNYSPVGINPFTKNPLGQDGENSARFFKQGADRIGGTYIKALYREYADENFEMKVEEDPRLGIMGPIIAAEVGDTIEVYFKNNATQPCTITPHGVYPGEMSGEVDPGNVRKYIWRIPVSVSPTQKDKNCIPYLYTSDAAMGANQHSGLIGPILICKKGTLDSELEKVPRVILLQTYDENLSPYLQRNIEKFTTNSASVNKEDEDFKESNRMRTINGLSYGSYFGLELCAGEDTDIYLIAVGSDINTHSFIVDGTVNTHRQQYSGIVGVLPHATATSTVRPYEAGATLYGCHISSHGFYGMFAFYRAKDCGNASAAKFEPSRRRKFYLGAVEEVWDYLPNPTDHKGNSVDNQSHPAYLETRQEDGKFIGTKYKKAIYYEYTDETFTERVPKLTHLGFQGPLLKMEIGDEVEVIFKNMASRPYSAQALGIFVEGLMQTPVRPAQPGEVVTYRWQARPEIAPTVDQPDCLVTSYVSFIHFHDINTGLRGPILICRKGTLRLGKGGGANEEFYLLFSIVDENLSHYIDDNIRDFAKVNPERFDKKGKDFVESNKMNHINGLMYHLPGLDMKRGDLVRWHLFGEGQEEVHSVHFHGNALIQQDDKENRVDVLNLHAGMDFTGIMRPDAVGEWLLHCHVNTHVDTGMVTTYRVHEESATCKSLCYTVDCEMNTHLDCSLLGITHTTNLLNTDSEIRVQKGKDVLLVPADDVTYLDLSHNEGLAGGGRLKVVLSHFPKLKTLKIDSANLTELSKDLLENNKMLTALHARRNKIHTIDEVFVNGQSNLAVLDLRYNSLRRIPVVDISIGRKSRLRRLDLRGNTNLPDCLNTIILDSTQLRSCDWIPFIPNENVPSPKSGL